MIIKQPKEYYVPGLCKLWKEAFKDEDSFIRDFFRTGFSEKRSLCILERDRVVAMCYWFDCGFQDRKLAYLYAVATAEDMQGQGLCRKLLEEAKRRLGQRGYSGILLVPGEPGLFRFYQKLGWQVCSGIEQVGCLAGEPVPLERLSAKEYAQLRGDFLPPGGVVQEGPALAFFETQGEFARGRDFLLAYRLEDGELFGAELLGNPGAAPGILGALDAAQGLFRVPGTQRPFAMYCPLDGEAAPGYFGLALD